MVNFAPKVKRLGWPSGLLGLFLSFNLLMVLLSFAAPVSDAGAFDACGGDYPCYTSAACAKANGTLHLCENQCPGRNQGFCFPNYGPEDKVPLSVSIGGLQRTIDLGEYIQAVYRYGVGAAAVLAAVMIMIGGLQWLTSRGGDQVNRAKKRITDASIGLAITVFAWFILNTINPALVNLQMPRIPMVQKQQFVQCDQFRLQVACGQAFGLAENENVEETAPTTERFRIVAVDDGAALAKCVGGSCSKAGSSDGNMTCQNVGGSAGEQPTSDPGRDISAPVAPYECRTCTSNGNRCDGPKGQNSSCCGGYCGISLAGEGARNWEVIWNRGLNRATYDAASALGDFALQMVDLPGVCRSGRDGDYCMGNNECLNGKCVLGADWQRGGYCSSGRFGARCDNDDQCIGEASCDNYICRPRATGAGGACQNTGDCPDGLVCNTATTLNMNKFCWDGVVAEDGSGENGSCSSGGEGDQECVERYGEGYECYESGFTGVLSSSTRCSNGAPGTICTEDAQCQINGQNGFCDKSMIIDTIDAGICVTHEVGAGCEYEGQPSFISRWLSGGSEPNPSSCSETAYYCVQEMGGGDRGVILRSGAPGKPCATGGPCGRQGTCNPGLVCSTTGNICYAE